MNNFLKLTPRVFIFTNLLWFLLFGFLLFNYKCSNQNNGNTNDCNNFCSNYSNEPLQGLTAKTAIDMADNYAALYDSTDSRGTVYYTDGSGRRRMKFRETKSVWFSVESMKRFIYHFEKNICQLNCKDIDKNALGLRFYFAKYPDSTTVASQISIGDNTFDFLTKPNMKGFYSRKTLFMVPTYWDGQTDVDFDPKWSFEKENGFCIRNMKSILDENKKNLTTFRVNAMFPDPNDPNGLQNHQPVCPPDNCPGQSF